MSVDGPQMAPDDNDEAVSGFSAAQCPVMSHTDMKQRQWFCLDEWIANSEEDGEAEGDQESSYTYITDSEIEAVFQHGLSEENQKGNEQKAKKGNEQCTVHECVTMEESGHNYDDVLPVGWIQIRHSSGVPLYFHSSTRICTFARPYYLGQGSPKICQVPLSAIPCLQYKQAWKKVKRENEELYATSNVQLPLGAAKIEMAEGNRASQYLDALKIHKYCRSLFRFKTMKKLKFESWSDRRRYAKSKKVEKQRQRLHKFPGTEKLIKVNIQNPDDPDAKPSEWLINPNGKSYICILQEYVQRTIKKIPTYEVKTMEENSLFRFSAMVIINGITHGCGTGGSKKKSKLSAAKAALEILIPEMREKLSSVQEEDDSLSIFDDVKVDDPRVTEVCAKTSEPFDVLLTCLQRNFDSKSMPFDYKVNPSAKLTNECIMTVGSHRAQVLCENEKAGKQMVSQAILRELHPCVNSWGSLLRLYGNRSMWNFNEHKEEQKTVSMIKEKDSSNPPNYAILGKLKSAMMKLNEESAERKINGRSIPPSDLPLPCSSRR